MGFVLQRSTVQHLAELAKASELSASAYLQCLVTMAHEAIVLEKPIRNVQFAPRLRQLAAQLEHSAKEKSTSFTLDDDDTNAIRELRAALRLPRKDLVVEYAVQAAWDTKPNGGGDGEREDPRDRKLFLARFHNVESSGPRHLRSLPHPDQARFFFDEEVSPKS